MAPGPGTQHHLHPLEQREARERLKGDVLSLSLLLTLSLSLLLFQAALGDQVRMWTCVVVARPRHDGEGCSVAQPLPLW